MMDSKENDKGSVALIRAGRREWIGLAVLALPTLLLALDLSVLFLAIPHLGAALQPSSIQMLWIMDIYGFMIAGFLVTMGTLGDRIGRRKLLMIGATVFGIASVLTAYSINAEMLIVTRALLGIAGATLMPSTLALISNMFKAPDQRGLAISVWMACFMVGIAIGPLVGGMMLEWFWWGSVFLLGVPVMALLLASAPALLPEYRDPQASRLDWTSVGLSLAALMPIIYGLKEMVKAGPVWLPVMSMLTGLLFGAAFIHRQRKLTNPLLDLRLLHSRTFSIALAVMLLSSAAMGGINPLVSQYLQLVEGMSPLRAGLWLVPPTLCVIAVSMLLPTIAKRVRPKYIIGAGLAVAAVGCAILTQVGSSSGLPVLMVGSIIAFAGIGPIGMIATNLVIGSAPPEKAGSASAMSETSGELGIALGVALLGSVSTAVYRGHMTDAIPAGIPADAAEATRDTLAGAVAMADRLPAGIATEILDSSREAFTNGLNSVAALSSVVLLIFAVLTVVLLRNVHSKNDL